MLLPSSGLVDGFGTNYRSHLRSDMFLWKAGNQPIRQHVTKCFKFLIPTNKKYYISPNNIR
jgi:hypothetical protein